MRVTNLSLINAPDDVDLVVSNPFWLEPDAPNPFKEHKLPEHNYSLIARKVKFFCDYLVCMRNFL